MADEYVCPVCDDASPSLIKLNEHLDRAHPVNRQNDSGIQPFINDRTKRFQSIRTKHVERLAITRARLELRLAKLLIGLQALASSSSTESSLWNWRDISATRKFEKEVVFWEDESVFERCRFCGQKFSIFMRKHHCRVCGLVTCGDVERECSLEVPAMLLSHKLSDLAEHFPDLLAVKTDFPIRICTECRTQLFSHRNYKQEVNGEQPRIIRLHYQLSKMQSEISGSLPRFEELMATLTKREVPDGDVARVRQSRQKLLLLFSSYDRLARKIRDLPVETETETRLRNQILAKSAVFLETTMIPLQTLPQALSYNEPQIKNKQEAELLQNKVVVLEEQRFLLKRQITEAKSLRQFDALIPMETSLAEISSEIDTLTKKLGQLAPTT